MNEPIPMLLWCPSCGVRHIDKGELATKPHHTHVCQKCGMVWRPAVAHTVGVQFLTGFKDEPDMVPSCYGCAIESTYRILMNGKLHTCANKQNQVGDVLVVRSGERPPCTCPATSEHDDPCPRHGVLGIGVTGRD